MYLLICGQTFCKIALKILKERIHLVSTLEHSHFMPFKSKRHLDSRSSYTAFFLKPTDDSCWHSSDVTPSEPAGRYPGDQPLPLPCLLCCSRASWPLLGALGLAPAWPSFSLPPGCPGPLQLPPIHFLASQLAEGLGTLPRWGSDQCSSLWAALLPHGAFLLQHCPPALLLDVSQAVRAQSPWWSWEEFLPRADGSPPPCTLGAGHWKSPLPCLPPPTRGEASSQQISTLFLFCPVPISPNESPEEGQRGWESANRG